MDHVVHWDDVKAKSVEAGPLSGTWADLGRAGGSVRTGLRRARLAAGMRSTPVHVHHAEEEIYVILEGSGLLWQDGSTCDVRAGDLIVEVAEGAAHTFIAGDAGLELLAYGTRAAAPTALLPRAGVAWLGPMWVEPASEPHPWGREIAAGALDVSPPGPRPSNVVTINDVPATKRAHSDVGVLRRDAATAAGSRVSGLQRCEVRPGKLGCVPHVHDAEEEVFVVLEGSGDLALYPCGVADPVPQPSPLRPGSVVVRPAGSQMAHALRAGHAGLTYLAYGERRPEDITYYPRSRKLSFRGLGVVGRFEPCDYYDGEPEA